MCPVKSIIHGHVAEHFHHSSTWYVLLYLDIQIDRLPNLIKYLTTDLVLICPYKCHYTHSDFGLKLTFALNLSCI